MQEGRDDAPSLFNKINAHIDKGTLLLSRLARLADILVLLGQDMTMDTLNVAWRDGMALATLLSDGQCRLQYLYNPTNQPDPNKFDPSDYLDSNGQDDTCREVSGNMAK